MKFFTRILAVLSTALLLASCGGGGGDGGAFTPAPATLALTASPTSIAPSGASNIEITAKKGDGTAVVDGTVINILLTPATLATASSGSVSTVGGRATFAVTAASTAGTVRVTTSMSDPGIANRVATATVDVTIAGTAPSAQFAATATPTTVTRNAQSNILVTLRRANGDAVADGTNINAVLSPVNIGSIAGSGTAGTTASNSTSGGRANFQFFSGNIDGTAQIVLSTIDPEDRARTLTTTVTISVAGDGSSRIRVTPSLSSITQNSNTDVAVVVTNRNGQPVADGSAVNLTVTPASIGTVANASGGSASNQASATTVGGRANFRFNSGSIDGDATLTASSADPDSAGATISANTIVRVSGVGVPRLSAVATTYLLPPNLFGVAPFIGSPYLSEIDVTWRRANGQLVTGTEIAVSVNPVTFGGFSMLDDPTTTDINEFTTIMGQAPVDVVAGKATLFFHSFTLPGSATVTITAVDPDTQETLQTQVVITVAASAVPLPSSVMGVTQNSAVYVQGSGGRTSATLIAQVMDGAGNPVPNPSVGSGSWNNVIFELQNAANLGGARLRAIDANGANQTAARVLSRTTNGQATATFESGTIESSITINVTADRADNNVGNGVQDPVTGTITLTVSDGKLYSIVLTSPTPNALTVNTVPSAGDSGDPTSPNVGPRNAGNNDGTYSLTVSALATDRSGNPVVQGTALRFGVIDAPLYGFPSMGHGFFYLTGADGNPVEGTNRFDAPTGQFTTSGGGAGPGDTLLVFGQLVGGQNPDNRGNRDLQEARTVAAVNSGTNLTINSSFNPNDDSGISVDNGAILPYVIGRATEVNIGADAGGGAVQASTNQFGVATVTMNYPVTRLGKAAYIYAQGDRSGGTTTTRKVTGTAGIALPGARPAKVTSTVTAIAGNRPFDLQVCLRDANNEALQGYFLRFGFHDLGSGTGMVDGVSGSGTTGMATGGDGCLLARINTMGITAQDSDAGVVFSYGDAVVVDVSITTGAAARNIVNISPSSLGSEGGTVTIRVTDAAGTPLAGLPISVECEASGAGARLLSTIPAVTGVNGSSAAAVSTVRFSGFGFSGSGSCTYTVGGGTAVVSVSGVDLCTPAGGTPPGAIPPAACVVPTPRVLVLQANPGSISGSGSVNLQLSDNTGQPVAGAQISGNCGAGAFIDGFIAPTGSDGLTSVAIQSSLTPPTCPAAAASATCTFVTTIEGGAQTQVRVTGPACAP